ncbi:Transcriptional activator protein NhaR (Na(+)/H(+) antiporter regulatory protein), partial [Durusdinium trenchii]
MIHSTSTHYLTAHSLASVRHELQRLRDEDLPLNLGIHASDTLVDQHTVALAFGTPIVWLPLPTLSFRRATSSGIWETLCGLLDDFRFDRLIFCENSWTKRVEASRSDRVTTPSTAPRRESIVARMVQQQERLAEAKASFATEIEWILSQTEIKQRIAEEKLQVVGCFELLESGIHLEFDPQTRSFAPLKRMMGIRLLTPRLLLTSPRNALPETTPESEPQMESFFLENVLTPPVLFFFLGLFAVWIRSDLCLPEQIAKFLSIYLLMAIGVHGGVELAQSGLTAEVALVLGIATLAAAAIPLWTFFILRTRLDVYNAAAIAATYGSISAVTFVTAVGVLQSMDMEYSGHMVAAMAMMESPAIVVGVLLARRFATPSPDQLAPQRNNWTTLVREAFASGPILLLTGSLAIGFICGPTGWSSLKPVLGEPFKGVLALFLLDMGTIAARSLKRLPEQSLFLMSFAVGAAVIHAGLGIFAGKVMGLTPGDTLLLAILLGSASYIAVPAAARLALPEANPGLYVPMSLGHSIVAADWLNYHHLLYFWTVAREGSISAACEQLHLAQPTISGQLRKLEQRVGGKLYRRIDRKLVLTELGQTVFKYADEMFTIGQELSEVLQGQPTGRPLKLNVGVPEVLPKLIAYRLLEPALQMADSVQLVCHEAPQSQLLARLASHELDVVFSDAPAGSFTHIRAFNPMLGECGVGVFGTSKLLKQFAHSPPHSLYDAPFLLPASGTALRRSLDQWLLQTDVPVRVVAEFDDTALMKVFAE